MPAQLGLGAGDQMLEDHALGFVQIAVIGLGGVPLCRELDLKGADSVGHDLLEMLRRDRSGLGQGEVKRVEVPVQVAEGAVVDRGQRPAAIRRDLIHRALGTVADFLGPDFTHQALVGQSLERPVDRADLDVGPGLGPVELRLLADLMPVQRTSCGQRAEDEETN